MVLEDKRNLKGLIVLILINSNLALGAARRPDDLRPVGRAVDQDQVLAAYQNLLADLNRFDIEMRDALPVPDGPYGGAGAGPDGAAAAQPPVPQRLNEVDMQVMPEFLRVGFPKQLAGVRFDNVQVQAPVLRGLYGGEEPNIRGFNFEERAAAAALEAILNPDGFREDVIMEDAPPPLPRFLIRPEEDA